ncbi:hypothetical protein [Vibrio renipiscarius]|uniref:Uncharacterized protein n=1 Tax=Vibrio renipiscarius TaxID=1461322 RepID=A0A0C2NIS0_9VIBR|nr:hypothetical protein [Vibrio renipiscarius]KII79431.1 hypothetical protein PL18_07110 [Vibrio renipiscarius]KII80940.1 hypothetical protein OJ16_06555 [Vibrio renipiscarius]
MKFTRFVEKHDVTHILSLFETTILDITWTRKIITLKQLVIDEFRDYLRGNSDAIISELPRGEKGRILSGRVYR